MANAGKFIDRSPVICPAGKVFTIPDQNVASCMGFYSLNEQIDALKHDVGIFKEKEWDMPWKQQRMQNNRHKGIYTEIRPAMMPPVKTRYQALINELKETTYDSLWNKALGSSRDYLSMLPEGTDPETVTYGMPPVKETTVKDLINPPKSVYEVLYDSQIGHELYKKTHNDYNPGEQLNRGYKQPPYNPNKTYGMTTIYDPRGIWVKCACQWHITEPVIPVSKIQADVEERTKPKIGKSLSPNNNIACVPKGFRFGNPCKRDLYSMQDLLKDPDCPPCLFKRDFLSWIETLNEIRKYVGKRRETFFNLKNFNMSLRYYDKNQDGWIPKEIVYKVCACKKLNLDPDAIEPLLKLMGIVREDNFMYYPRFVQLIDKNYSVPEIVKINDIPPQNRYFLTTQQAAMCDYLIMDNSHMKPAGVPSWRTDLSYPVVHDGGCRADLESLGEETTVEILIKPSIFTNYGISHRDMFKPREASVIRTIFENIGYKFTDETFDKYWQLGLEKDKTGLVCIDTFRHLLKENVPPKPFEPKTERLVDLGYCKNNNKEKKSTKKQCECICAQ